jgi:hypothetical protein
MHGDFSRETFDPRAGYRSVLLQQGRVLLDADWNEQGAITARHDEVRTRDVVGSAGGPVDGAAFEVTDGAGATPVAAAWGALRLGPGRFYVDGVLTEVAPDAESPNLGPSLADQPFLPQVGALPGLAEPSANGRYAAVLDTWTRQVTADEVPSLLESALGGPDTTTRAQTAWQVRLQAVDADDACASLTGAAWLTRTPPTMTASLAEPDPDTDPCEISASEGYRRLENQLYRVQVVSVDSGGAAEVVWSRENGSVVAGLVQIASSTDPGVDAELHLDREGRDDELSIRSGDVVEVTSRDRELHGLPALLGTAGAPDGLVLPVTWLGSAGSDPGTADVANLGAAPIVRRWEGGPVPASTSQQQLEDGVQVAFGSAGEFRIGDYWLIPARTVRLVYGVSALGGTIEWPEIGGVPQPQPPQGPFVRSTTIAVLDRSGGDGSGAWSLVSDCRLLFPALTDLVTIDLLGGDGQESLPGSPLDEPVRVVVRNGGLPVDGTRVRFDAPDGHLDAGAAPATTDPSSVVVSTDDAGYAEVRWLLGTSAPVTQVLTAVRLDDADDPVGAQVRVTARRSQADQVAWQPVCRGFAETETVQQALAQLATTADLRLLGGDGQQVLERGATLAHPVRVVLDSPCGPVVDSTVIATATDGALVAPARDGQPPPPTLVGTGATGIAEAATDVDGVASFWWQPNVDQRPSDVLSIAAKDPPAAPIIVTAHLGGAGEAGARPGGVHVTELRFASGTDFGNDDDVKVDELITGIMAFLDGPVVQASVRGKPVVRVLVDLPWPIEGDGHSWHPEPVGFRQVELGGEANADGPLIVWRPSERTQVWLLEGFRARVRELTPNAAVTAWFQIDGWAIVSESNPREHLNGHARSVVERRGGRTRLALPTDDEVTGGQFVQWFHLG